MSSGTAPTSRTFPDQKAIIDFFNNHEATKEGCFEAPVMKHFSLEKVAACFANKTMSRNEIESKVNICFAPAIPNKDAKILVALMGGMQGTVARGASDLTGMTHDFEESIQEIKGCLPSEFTAPAGIYTIVLRDLFDRTTGASLKTGEPSRHVADLTKEKS